MDSSANQYGVDDVPISTIDTSNEIKEEPVETKEEPIDEFADIKLEDPLEEPIADDVPMSTIDASNEIKEEPVETKEEPIDEFADVKQEDPLEKPIADIFCPSTGISPSMEVDCSDATNPHNLNGESSKFKISRKCVVCHRSRNYSEMRRFTKIENRRLAWVNAVRSTPEGRKSLMERLSATKESFLCASHFSPSDYTQTSKCAVRKPHAVPFFTDSTSIVRGDFLRSSYESTVHEEIKDERVDEFSDVKLEEPIEEPIVDIYHPHTVKYSPLEQSLSLGMTYSNAPANYCMQCHMKFRDKYHFERHMRTHTGEKPFSCPYCDMFSNRLTSLKSHIRTLHRMKPYVCLTCHSQFDLQSELKKHILLNRGHQGETSFDPAQKRNNIGLGDEKTSIDGGSHLREEPIKEEPNDELGPYRIFGPFSTIDRPLDQSSLLDMVSSYYCSECDKTCLNKSHFDFHMRSHLDGRQFGCRFCDNFFNSSEVRDNHIRKIHRIKDSPLNSDGVAGLPLFTLDSPYESKEEPVEIKEEPIDEFADIKQEEPIADILCPSTGVSRPINQKFLCEEGPVEKRCKYGLREERTFIDNESDMNEEPIEEEPIYENGPSK